VTIPRFLLRCGLAVCWVGCLLLILMGCTPAAKGQTPPPPASHGKTTKEAPSANVSKIQAWKDAELIASLAPGRTEVVGAGDSMKPMYGENTILVISKIAYDELKVGMSVVYSNARGRQVVHQLLKKEAAGWRVQGLNNATEDRERVTRANLIGVIYASVSYSNE
jgi:hypothetical protein